MGKHERASGSGRTLWIGNAGHLDLRLGLGLGLGTWGGKEHIYVGDINSRVHMMRAETDRRPDRQSGRQRGTEGQIEGGMESGRRWMDRWMGWANVCLCIIQSLDSQYLETLTALSMFQPSPEGGGTPHQIQSKKPKERPSK